MTGEQSELNEILVLAEAGLSKQKSELVLRKFCEEHCRDRVSYDLAMHPTTCSKKLTVALWKIKAALKWLGLLG